MHLARGIQMGAYRWHVCGFLRICWPKRAVLKIGLVTCPPLAVEEVELLEHFLGTDWCTRENLSDVARGIADHMSDEIWSKKSIVSHVILIMLWPCYQEYSARFQPKTFNRLVPFSWLPYDAIFSSFMALTRYCCLQDYICNRWRQIANHTPTLLQVYHFRMEI